MSESVDYLGQVIRNLFDPQCNKTDSIFDRFKIKTSCLKISVLETKLAAADVISAGYFDASSFTTIFASLCLSTAERGVLTSCPSPSFP